MSPVNCNAWPKERLLIICGIELKGNDANLALLEVNDSQCSYVDIEPKRISLNDDESNKDVIKFYDAISGYFRDNHVNLIAIKRRNKKGQYAGGSITFKIEGLIQHCSQCEIEFLAAQTISAAHKKYNFTIPGNVNKSQEQAYLTGYCAHMRRKKD